jgi:pimeloyl-ACP methyl ester carboxylesterase
VLRQPGYSANRLGDDVLAVIEALKLDRPLLAGHSIAGEELSSVASRQPQKVSGLVYFDAAYGYAYYNRDGAMWSVDLAELHRKLERMLARPDATLVQELLNSTLPDFAADPRQIQNELPAGSADAPPALPFETFAILEGEQKYTSIPAPVLAIYAAPEGVGPVAQAKAFEKGVPSAHVVMLSGATHYVFQSNEADVLREMKAFIESLR